eukprot:GGOE01002506.1.p1 GENE.GGOE01002506.1~~GGOE01002506.1.p1  ORF type:complete len:1082 (+),score=373.55 GGOE01002506.1:175-3246(+)
MSYNYASFSPGPHLNLIVAPNGCGKSTIVAAICLGLAGKVMLLGKSNQVRDFVQRGKGFAELEIELHAADHCTVSIKRHIVGNTSRWYIDGRERQEREVVNLVEKLNIKLENLTQFLPQERVKSFSQLSPTELLDSTEEAILPPEVVELHAKLIEQGKSHHVSQQQLEHLEKRCQRLRDLNQVDARDVERHNQQQMLLRQAAEFAMGVPYAESNQKKEEGKHLKADLNEKRLQLEKHNAALQPLEAARAAAEKAVRAVDAEGTRLEATIKSAEEDCTRHQREFDKLGRDIDALVEEEGQLAGREKQRQENMARVRRQKDDSSQQLSALQLPQEDEMRVKEKVEQVRRYDQRETDLAQAIEDINNRIVGHMKECTDITAQLSRLANVREQRLKACQEVNPRIVEVWQWIQAHRGQLKGNVYMPALELDITHDDPHHAKYLEASLPSSFLFGIICEQSEDRDFIAAELKDRQKRSFTVIARHLDPADQQGPRRLCPIEKLQSLGITHWLDQAISAPDVVMVVMREMSPVHFMAVGQRELDIRDSHRLCPELRKVFTPQCEYSTRRSRYEQQLLSTTITPLREPRIFRAVAVRDSKALEERQKKLRETLTQLQEGKSAKKHEQTQLWADREWVLQEKMRLQTQVQEYHRLKRTVDQRARELMQLEQEVSMQEEQARIAESIRRKNERRVQVLGLLRHAAGRHVEATMQRGLVQRRRRALQHTADLKRDELEAAQRQLRDVRAQCTAAQRLCEEVEAQLKRLHSEFHTKRAEFTQQWGASAEDVKNICRQLPTDPDTLRAEARRCEAEADAIAADPQKVEEYKKRKAEIDSLEQQINTHKRGVEEQQRNIEECKQRWMVPLQESVKKLDEIFQEYCQYQGIQGKVQLEPDTASDSRQQGPFEDYTIQLMCSFRKGEPLQRLTAQRQSGGERAVVTMLYLLALQSMNVCPIRVVDEIDQGMDASNQRKIFLKMLESSAADEAPQSFLITPKFTPGLVPEDAQHLDIFVVMNGPQGVAQDLFNGVADAG